jgi:hypothetical protein
MLYTILILRDSTYRTSLLTRYWDVNDSVIWTSSETLTAADTYAVVDLTLRSLWIELNSVLRASVLTSTSHTTAAEVSNIVVSAYAR